MNSLSAELQATDTRILPNQDGTITAQQNNFYFGHCGGCEATPARQLKPAQSSDADRIAFRNGLLFIAIVVTVGILTPIAIATLATTSNIRQKVWHTENLTKAQQNLEQAENKAIAAGFTPAELVPALKGDCK